MSDSNTDEPRMPAPRVSEKLLTGMNDLVQRLERDLAANPTDRATREVLEVTKANLAKALATTGQTLAPPDTRNEFERRRDDLDRYVDDLIKSGAIPDEMREAMAQSAAAVRRRHGRGS